MNTFERLVVNQLTPLFNTQGVNTMAITTVTKVKSYLGISDTTQDSKISALIPLVEQQYLEIRNAPWEVDDQGETVYPVGSDITAAEMIQYKLNNSTINYELQSETIGSYSYNRSTASRNKGYPSEIVSAIKRYIRAV
jgi:hypothetical protein